MPPRKEKPIANIETQSSMPRATDKSKRRLRKNNEEPDPISHNRNRNKVSCSNDQELDSISMHSNKSKMSS